MIISPKGHNITTKQTQRKVTDIRFQIGGVPVVVQWKQIRLGTMRLRVRSLALLHGLRIQCCRELWGRLQMRLGSHVAVAVVWAGGYSSDSTPSLETSIYAAGVVLKQRNKKLSSESST